MKDEQQELTTEQKPTQFEVLGKQPGMGVNLDSLMQTKRISVPKEQKVLLNEERLQQLAGISPLETVSTLAVGIFSGASISCWLAALTLTDPTPLQAAIYVGFVVSLILTLLSGVLFAHCIYRRWRAPKELLKEASIVERHGGVWYEVHPSDPSDAPSA